MHTRRQDQELSLIEAAQSESQTAYHSLVLRYRPLVRSVARNYYLLGGDRNDLLQEGLIGLCKAIRDYDPSRGSFRAFAELCIRRHIISAVKAASRKKYLPLNTAVSYDQEVLGPGDVDGGPLFERLTDLRSCSAEEACLQIHDRDRLFRGLARELSPLEAGTLRLFYNGRSYADIAVELEVPPKTVDNALQRVRRKISQITQAN